MGKKESGAGFQQAAGLIRYFEAEEESAIHLDARAVIAFCLLTAVVTIVFNWQCSPGTGCF
ncbi:MAG: preprotein translocase subunit Sec61beta [Candidatus Thermoplasmatota archaeon]|nr:preprotein translocase subunit Sec61beta [Candidatus Thermoplasmatota archaeon]